MLFEMKNNIEAKGQAIENSDGINSLTKDIKDDIQSKNC